MKRLLQLISLVFTLIGTFLGLIYWKGDEYLMIAISVSMFFTIVFFFIVDMLIKNKENIRKRKLSSLSIFLWFSFLIFSFLSSIIILHGLNVQFNAKADIQKQTLNKLSLLEGMTTEYKKIVKLDCSAFENNLNTKLNDFRMSGESNNGIYKELNSPPYNINKKQLSKIKRSDSRYKTKFLTKYKNVQERKFNKEIDDVEFKVKKFLKNNMNSIKKWNILDINTIYYQLDIMLADNKNQLTETFNKYKTSEDSNFIYQIPIESIPLKDPIKLWKLYNPHYLFGILSVFYLLLLSPFLIHGDKKREYKGQTINLEGGIEI